MLFQGETWGWLLRSRVQTPLRRCSAPCVPCTGDRPIIFGLAGNDGMSKTVRKYFQVGEAVATCFAGDRGRQMHLQSGKRMDHGWPLTSLLACPRAFTALQTPVSSQLVTMRLSSPNSHRLIPTGFCHPLSHARCLCALACASTISEVCKPVSA